MTVIGALVLAATLAFAGCGGGSGGTDTGGGTATISSISELPRATSPMASAAASISKSVSMKAASTGLNLWTTVVGSFDANSSRGACETVNLVKQAVGGAMQADMIICYVSTMNSLDSFAGLIDGNGNAIDIYDGEYHVFNLNMSGDEYAPSRIKFKIAKNSSGSINLFEMFMCSNTPGGLVQNEYTSQAISGNSVTMRAIGQHSEEGSSGWHSVDLTGTLNSDRVFTQKEVISKDQGDYGGEAGAEWQEGTFTQTPGIFYYSGYSANSNRQSVGFSYGQMINDTSTNVSQLAMGDGAVQWTESGTYQGSPYSDGNTDSWDGDTTLPIDPATDSAYYNEANDGVMATVDVDGLDFAFAVSETWDCTDDVGTGIVDLPEVNASDIQAACTEYGSDNHEWIDCHSVFDGG